MSCMATSESPVSERPAAAQSAISGLREAGLDAVLYLPGSEPYEARIASYWSLSPQLERPWAIVQPRTSEEVSTALKVLVGVPGCCFAIRSGGHLSWPGANSIESGITIDMGLMNKTTYNPDTNVASLEPGGRWMDVYTTIEKEGVMVAGGREGLVGVGGFLLGGGISYYSCRVGMACDQVINYEVVLADGSIVDANENTNQDLFRVLKGGGNNFGIITRFDMMAFPAHDVWYGSIIHHINETDAVIDALVKFTNTLDVARNPEAHYLTIWTHSPETEDISIASNLTHLDGVPNHDSLKDILAIPGRRTLRKRSMATKVVESLTPSNKYDVWLTINFRNDAHIARKCIDVLLDLVEHIKTENIPDNNFVAFSVLQPLPRSFARHSAARGGNVLGIDRIQDNAIILMTAIEVETWELAQAILPKFKAGIDEIEAYAASLDGAVEFIYGNYCDGTQDPIATYGEGNIKKMTEAAKKYDPTGVFQTRMPGGFKISKVSERSD
ncbi:Bifunctional solanapyrone synthase [Cytospora mali]|uniref:Bifunctional solanapyrone synthase n=1 Tax=Cytospora mali TaxID=578113 RepID=A0A194VQL5_CYTMA|nr:Bifunctional solanapyrone synthase [Valsa mali]